MSDFLTLPPKTDRRWGQLALGENATPPRLLALKFMLTRIIADVKKDPSTLQKGIEELHEFFLKNPRIVQADTAALFH